MRKKVLKQWLERPSKACEARSLFGEYERDYFAPMFVFCNKMSFDTYAEALEKAHEMYNFVHGKE